MAKVGDRRYNASVEAFRDEEYPMLNGSVYLDHAGSTLYSKSLMDRFASDMALNLFGNPHSASASSQLSTSRIEDIRLRALQFFNADPSEFDLIFVANATAGIKLVAEAFRAVPGGFNYAYHQASHTSLVGAREEAQNSACLEDLDVERWIAGEAPFDPVGLRGAATLFAYPAQSNMDGTRFPISWSEEVRLAAGAQSGNVYTLLDAAALVSTSPLDLSDAETAPDFVVLSFYKIFGFPDLGALIVRHQAESIFEHRRYFGGGTVDTVVCKKEKWHASKSQSLHDRLEDGTLPIHSIIALNAALDVHQRLFGTMINVASHTSFLVNCLYHSLDALRHGNDTPVCVIYSRNPQKQDAGLAPGPIVAFNIQNHQGAWASLTEFEKLATLRKFHVRTGGVCNPGGIASALGLEPWEMKNNFSAGFRCGADKDIMAGKPTGVIRASLGAMSTMADVEKFVAFVSEFYRDQQPCCSASLTLLAPRTVPPLYVHSLTVYPIKSCGGFAVPKDTDWEVRPEGLAWDREWCLVHRGSGQALNQKRHPKMVLIRPSLDFGRGQLRISYMGDSSSSNVPKEIAVPLSNNPALFRAPASHRTISSRVCGEEIAAQTYISPAINDFFSDILGVPCMLARFPPGGQGKSMRHAKAHLQSHQIQVQSRSGVVLGAMPSYPAPPSPPDSDSENAKRRILLSNESPVLAVTLSSLKALNEEIRKRRGREVAADVFRANVVLGFRDPSSGDQAAYSEDHWSTLTIGQQRFKMLGSCRRCHMICINQQTGERNEEPFVTLAKTRRFDGKVFFGTHMGHTSAVDRDTRAAQYPTVRVGDDAQADVQLGRRD